MEWMTLSFPRKMCKRLLNYLLGSLLQVARLQCPQGMLGGQELKTVPSLGSQMFGWRGSARVKEHCSLSEHRQDTCLGLCLFAASAVQRCPCVCERVHRRKGYQTGHAGNPPSRERLTYPFCFYLGCGLR